MKNMKNIFFNEENKLEKIKIENLKENLKFKNEKKLN